MFGSNFRASCGRSVAIFGMLVGAAILINSIALLFYFPENIEQVKCTESTCLLNRYNKNDCYAKFKYDYDSNFKVMNCRGFKKGIYTNLTSVCDIDQNGYPKVYCEGLRMNDILYFIVLCILFSVQFVGAIVIFACAAVLFESSNQFKFYPQSANFAPDTNASKNQSEKSSYQVELDDV